MAVAVNHSVIGRFFLFGIYQLDDLVTRHNTVRQIKTGNILYILLKGNVLVLCICAVAVKYLLKFSLNRCIVNKCAIELSAYVHSVCILDRSITQFKQLVCKLIFCQIFLITKHFERISRLHAYLLLVADICDTLLHYTLCVIEYLLAFDISYKLSVNRQLYRIVCTRRISDNAHKKYYCDDRCGIVEQRYRKALLAEYCVLCYTSVQLCRLLFVALLLCGPYLPVCTLKHTL